MFFADLDVVIDDFFDQHEERALGKEVADQTDSDLRKDLTSVA